MHLNLITDIGIGSSKLRLMKRKMPEGDTGAG
jgi:hypothetical protein